MELKYYVSLFARWAWLIVLAPVVAGVISLWVSAQMPPVYSATTTLMVGQVLQNANPQMQDFSTGQQLAQTYMLLVKRQPLLQATVDSLSLSMPWQALGNRVTASVVPQTLLLQVAVIDSTPERARVIADEVARQLILQSPTPVEKEQEQQAQFVGQQLSGLQARIKQADVDMQTLDGRMSFETSARGVTDVQSQIAALQSKVGSWQTTYASLLANRVGRTNNLSVVEPAIGPLDPISPNIPFNALIAVAIGLTLAVPAVLVLEMLDDTIKTHEQVNALIGLPLLGTISRFRIRANRDRPGQPARVADTRSLAAEAYRVLRTNVQLSTVGIERPVVLVTSSVPGEGKTTTACNLASMLAQAGKRVILCDCDLRRPAIHERFGVPDEVGITSLLLDDSLPVEAAVVDGPLARLRLLPSGPVPPNPSELLGSDAMRTRIEALREIADVVLIDSPAVVPVADASVLATLCSGAVLVIDASRTRRELVRQSKAILDGVGIKMLGVVLNKAQGTSNAQHYAVDNGARARARWRRLLTGTVSSLGLHR